MTLTMAVAFGLALAQDCPDYSGDPGLLMSLEEYAGRGALSEDEKACLEKHYAQVPSQTTKDKISRVLMVNGYAYSTQVWLDLVHRHLDEVDRSDPDIAYLYAYHIFNNTPERSPEVVAWTEVALERKDVWTGDQFVSRVYGLMKLRTTAAVHLWKTAEEAAAKSGDLAESEAARTTVKSYAREWMDFARVAGRSTDEAAAMCISAASAQACGISG